MAVHDLAREAAQNSAHGGEQQELLVYSGNERCSYLPGRTARLPLRLPLAPLSREDLDRRLAAGDRRSGAYLYRTECPTCKECEPIRLPIGDFEIKRTRQRVLKKGDRELEVSLHAASVDRERLELFNRHRRERGLARRESDLDSHAFRSFLVDSCCETIEIACRRQGALVAVAICDRGATSLNAVYCYHEPSLAHLSLGVYCILKEIELCRDWGLAWLYLGLFIAGSPHMAYKAGYRPHERLIRGEWRRFD
jgi:arginyl-tRNA--protein-N-Asp/Glu arginylyltransferase